MNWTFKEQLDYAKNVCGYAHENLPDAFGKLLFDPNKDDLSSLCGKVTETINKSDIHIGVKDYERESTYFIQGIPFKAQFYMVEAKFFKAMPNEALKIGFAYLYEAMRKVFPVVVLDHLSDDLFTGHMLESTVDYFLCEDGNKEENEFNKKSAKYWARVYHKAHQNLNYYCRKDLGKFFGYIPKKPMQKELKNLMARGLSLDMGVLQKFLNSEDEDNGCFGYLDFFGLLYDLDSVFENEYFEGHSEMVNNSGISFPCGYQKFQGGELVGRTTEEDVLNFNKVCDFLEDYVQFLYKHFDQ